LDVGWMCGKGTAKQRMANKNLVVEWKKDE
jgi:hypothetical protein